MAAPSTGAATAAPASARCRPIRCSTTTRGGTDKALWVNPRDSNHVVVGGVYLRQTFDGGATWQWISNGIHVDHHVIVEDPRYDDAGNRTVFFGNDGGVYKTTDIRDAARAGYTALNNNLGVTQFYGAAGHADTGTIVGGTQDNGTLVNEPLQATRWEQSLPGDGGVVASDATDASYFYAGMIYLQIQRSSNGGRDWTNITDGIADAFRNANFIAPLVLDPNDPNRMFAGGTRLWRSVDVQEREAGVGAGHERRRRELHQRDRGRAGAAAGGVGAATTWDTSIARQTRPRRYRASAPSRRPPPATSSRVSPSARSTPTSSTSPPAVSARPTSSRR